MEFIIADYSRFSREDIASVKEMIIAGGEVSFSTLDRNLAATHTIGVIRDNRTIVGTASIKHPRPSYVNSVFTKSKCNLPPEVFDLELGYVFIDSAFRGKNLSYKICSQLVSLVRKRAVFATTRTDNVAMQYTLQKLGFEKAGIPYKGRNEKNNIQVWCLKATEIQSVQQSNGAAAE